MLIKNFIEQINKQLPPVSGIIEKYKFLNDSFDHAKANQFINDNTLVYNGNDDGDSVEDLINHTNISNVGIGSITFLSKVHNVGNKAKEFARHNDFYKIAEQNPKIIIFSEEDEMSEEILANNFNDFLEFLVEYSKYDRELIFKTKFDKTETTKVLNRLLNKGFSSLWLSRFLSEMKSSH